MDILDVLWWSLGAYILIRIVRRDQPRLWLAFGLVAGLGLFTKFTIVFFLPETKGKTLEEIEAHFEGKATA